MADLRSISSPGSSSSTNQSRFRNIVCGGEEEGRAAQLVEVVGSALGEVVEEEESSTPVERLSGSMLAESFGSTSLRAMLNAAFTLRSLPP